MNNHLKKQNNVQTPPIVRLRYKQGETVFKCGDYGISIYRILKGGVEIYLEGVEEETSLAVFGPGELIGEMVFFLGNQERRSASARAVENTVLEAWHPTRISQEYKSMPLLLRHITNQMAKRLVSTNRAISKLEKNRPKAAEQAKHYGRELSRRKHFRKKADIVCSYRPNTEDVNAKWELQGKTIDISRAGIGMEFSKENMRYCSHSAGDEFIINAMLAPEKSIEVKAKVARTYTPPDDPRTMGMGLFFQKVNPHAQKNLGFFLMN